MISDSDSEETISQYSGKTSYTHKERLYNQDIENQEIGKNHHKNYVQSSYSDFEDFYQKKLYQPSTIQSNLSPYNSS